jgi:hypothetical protein
MTVCPRTDTVCCLVALSSGGQKLLPAAHLSVIVSATWARPAEALLPFPPLCENGVRLAQKMQVGP